MHQKDKIIKKANQNKLSRFKVLTIRRPAKHLSVDTIHNNMLHEVILTKKKVHKHQILISPCHSNTQNPAS